MAPIEIVTSCDVQEPVVLYAFIEDPPLDALEDVYVPACELGTNFDLTGELIGAKLDCDAALKAERQKLNTLEDWTREELARQSLVNGGYLDLEG